jgi:hypothetical protein
MRFFVVIYMLKLSMLGKIKKIFMATLDLLFIFICIKCSIFVESIGEIFKFKINNYFCKTYTKILSIKYTLQ